MKRILLFLVMALVLAASASAAQCAATTKKGTRCSRKAVVGQYCKQHDRMLKAGKLGNKSKSIATAADDSERCIATTKKGARCKLKAVNGTSYCTLHTK